MSEIPSSNTPGSTARRWRRASADITKSFVASLATGESSIAPTSGSTVAAPGHGAAGRRYVARRALQAKTRTRGSQPSRGTSVSEHPRPETIALHGGQEPYSVTSARFEEM
jgi:hypothetical protein